MKVSIIRRNGEIEVHQGRIGALYVGQRLEQVSFETASELKKLATPEGQRWLAHLVNAMKHH